MDILSFLTGAILGAVVIVILVGRRVVKEQAEHWRYMNPESVDDLRKRAGIGMHRPDYGRGWKNCLALRRGEIDMDEIVMQCSFDENDKPPWLIGLRDPEKAREMWIAVGNAWIAAVRILSGWSTSELRIRPPAKG